LDPTYSKIRYIPNTGHSLAGSDVIDTVAAVYYSIVNSIELPNYIFHHNYTADGVTVTVKVLNNMKPSRVLLWSANNRYSRDFRMASIGASFSSKTLTESEPNVWTVSFPNPSVGYTALTIELVYDNFIAAIQKSLKVTTSAYIVPDTYVCAGSRFDEHLWTTLFMIVLLIIVVLV